MFAVILNSTVMLIMAFFWCELYSVISRCGNVVFTLRHNFKLFISVCGQYIVGRQLIDIFFNLFI